MMESTAYFSRRRWLELMLAAGGALATGSLYEILAQLPSRQVTPNMVLSHGRYAHQSDPNIAASLDLNFQGFGVQLTDREGQFRFKTVKPGPYPSREGTWMRAPHIHFDIQGRVDRKVTQLYFPNEPLNDQDRLLQTVRGDRNALLGTVEAAGLLGSPGDLLVRWDIILASG